MLKLSNLVQMDSTSISLVAVSSPPTFLLHTHAALPSDQNALTALSVSDWYPTGPSRYHSSSTSNSNTVCTGLGPVDHNYSAICDTIPVIAFPSHVYPLILGILIICDRWRRASIADVTGPMSVSYALLKACSIANKSERLFHYKWLGLSAPHRDLAKWSRLHLF